MRRVLAVLGAVAIVVVAVVVRGALDSGGGDGSERSGGGLVVVCDTSLEAYCDALPAGTTVRVEESATTSVGIVDGEADDVDLWLTTDAWLEVTSGRARREIGTAELVATTPVAVATDTARAGAVAALCADQAVWRCLGDHAGQEWSALDGDPRWGPLRTGLPDADTATGLSVLASAAAGRLGSTDFAANDFDAGFRSWLTALTAASGRGDRDPLAALLRKKGQYTAAGVLTARAQRTTDAPTLLDTSPIVEARIVAVALNGPDDAPGLSSMRSALVADGWAGDEGAPQPLFEPGVLGALHDLWKDVAR